MTKLATFNDGTMFLTPYIPAAAERSCQQILVLLAVSDYCRRGSGNEVV